MASSHDVTRVVKACGAALTGFTNGLFDFLIQLLPRIVRGSLLMMMAAAAISVSYIALRVMWFCVCWMEDWLST